ncbi:MAG: hypothetical protein IT426_06240 [Pirellulales bacterium]|nr:hypothetical protein [Pirellulales bacterium]
MTIPETKDTIRGDRFLEKNICATPIPRKKTVTPAKIGGPAPSNFSPLNNTAKNVIKIIIVPTLNRRVTPAALGSELFGGGPNKRSEAVSTIGTSLSPGSAPHIQHIASPSAFLFLQTGQIHIISPS